MLTLYFTKYWWYIYTLKSELNVSEIWETALKGRALQLSADVDAC
jgi:hypothetical protein